jgi:dipeptidyl aminopeptidase/acylaminoacyl peptidase
LLRNSVAVHFASVVVMVSSLAFAVTRCHAQQAKKPFTVVDEIGLALFGYPAEVLFSPDGNYFVVKTERGRLDIMRVEDAVCFYRSQDVKKFLDRSDQSDPPPPVWVAELSTSKRGPIVNDWRWLPDSSGIAFLESGENGSQRLVVADLGRKLVEPLTSETEAVETFDIRDRQHYVYTVTDPAEQEKITAESKAAAVVGMGRPLYELLFPGGRISAQDASSILYAVAGGKRLQIKKDGAPLVLALRYKDIALSPDGGSAVAILPVLDVPASWENLYPLAGSVSSLLRIHPGHYDAKSRDVHVFEYVRIDLQTGSIQSLADAPTSMSAGWLTGHTAPSWSNDGHLILLPGTFLKSKENAPSRPCVAVVDISSNTSTCVEMLKQRTQTGFEEGYHTVWGARFAGGDRHRILVTFLPHADEPGGATEYEQGLDGTWKIARLVKGESTAGDESFKVTVKEGLNDPPVLVAANKKTSRVIWDPNPQLKNLELGEATGYTWKDKGGKQWKGGLYMPADYKAGHRYPLVIQTHGFEESKFLPSGAMTTAFAARALAASGIMVLQTAKVVAGTDCSTILSEEGPCVVSEYEAAADQLVSEGLVDPDKIGIIGFSRTCFYVMETLTTSSLHIKAASMTDGIMADYLQYMMWQMGEQYDLMIGTKPFGEGLQQWLKRSPGFNLEKVTAPLLVVGEGPISLLSMWQPYAGLRYLSKPVDLIMLNTDEHVLTNPSVRLASQGGSVDWFRFWLQGYEDPDPAKADQYRRWHELRRMEQENEAKSKAVASGQ